jgi:hypothetical protein
MAEKRSRIKWFQPVLLALVIFISCTLWFIDDPVVSFLSLFSFVSYLILGLAGLLVLLVAARILRLIIPRDMARMFKTNRLRYHLAILSGGVFFLVAGVPTGSSGVMRPSQRRSFTLLAGGVISSCPTATH